jgi:hypothetical protein
MLTLRLVFAKAAVKITFFSRKFFCFVNSPRVGFGSWSQLCVFISGDKGELLAWHCYWNATSEVTRCQKDLTLPRGTSVKDKSSFHLADLGLATARNKNANQVFGTCQAETLTSILLCRCRLLSALACHSF